MFPGWEYITNLEHHYNGRIWVTWRPDYFQTIVVSMMDQAVTCEILNICGRTRFYLTMIYGHNSKKGRTVLWNYLSVTNQGQTLPWLITGDFNYVLNQDNRIGGNPITMGEIEDFNECVVKCGLNSYIVEVDTHGVTSRGTTEFGLR
ncbi:hypothetical protein KY290_001010 [Solanum tuberosum]|uniref:Endonuclease/exonuclease/phosphatase n=1 Tax=Solanum tuberosum TaxID=4113 RepID=A0ABQ7WN57_SOLTU|nr:hypothetical protein KY290_001010 [Solanum tuberosum]